MVETKSAPRIRRQDRVLGDGRHRPFMRVRGTTLTSSVSNAARQQRSAARRALSRSARRNLVSLFAAAALIVVGYAGLAILQMGALNSGVWWIRDIIQLRDIFYRRQLARLAPDTPKTLFIGGSGTLFSVNSRLIENLTSQPTLNMGVHAGLDIDLLFAPSMPWIKPGDRVVAPLEWSYYVRPTPTELSGPNLLAIFHPYASAIKPSRLFRLLTSTPPASVAEGLVDRFWQIESGENHAAQSDPNLLAEWKRAHAPEGAGKYGPYGFSTMDDHGDKVLPVNMSADDIKALKSIVIDVPLDFPFGDWSVDGISDWRGQVTRRGADFYLTWPILDDTSHIFSEHFWAAVIEFARRMAAAGNPLYCDPVGAVTPMQYRYDLPAHFNIKGQDLYSRGLAACLADIDHQAFDYEHADPKVMAARARARIEALKKPPDPLYFAYERNIRELQNLERELGDIRSRSGAYPDALPALPEPASSFPPAHLWYRSSGTDYKLLVEDPDECRIVRLVWTEMIDPKRTGPDGCGAYGYWTAGAADW